MLKKIRGNITTNGVLHESKPDWLGFSPFVKHKFDDLCINYRYYNASIIVTIMHVLLFKGHCEIYR